MDCNLSSLSFSLWTLYAPKHSSPLNVIVLSDIVQFHARWKCFADSLLKLQVAYGVSSQPLFVVKRKFTCSEKPFDFAITRSSEIGSSCDLVA